MTSDNEINATQWCLVGNVIGDHPCGEGDRQSRRGTKQFRAGTKVYCLPPQWGDGYERILVIGRQRASHKFITLIMPAKYITNWRAKVVYNPEVIRRLQAIALDDWIPSWPFREQVEQFAEGMIEREKQERKRGEGIG